jgi:hypothetical protein
VLILTLSNDHKTVVVGGGGGGEQAGGGGEQAGGGGGHTGGGGAHTGGGAGHGGGAQTGAGAAQLFLYQHQYQPPETSFISSNDRTRMSYPYLKLWNPSNMTKMSFLTVTLM